MKDKVGCLIVSVIFGTFIGLLIVGYFWGGWMVNP